MKKLLTGILLLSTTSCYNVHHCHCIITNNHIQPPQTLEQTFEMRNMNGSKAAAECLNKDKDNVMLSGDTAITQQCALL